MVPDEAEVWTMKKGERVARCVVVRHPLGLELRCLVDGELVRSNVHRDPEELKIMAFSWQEAFTAGGWR